ncbi:MAG: hypothetical protein GY810_30490 [Aureispira sp.]|nr:hypothetical protein [Aureispira sp.]
MPNNVLDDDLLGDNKNLPKEKKNTGWWKSKLIENEKVLAVYERLDQEPYKKHIVAPHIMDAHKENSITIIFLIAIGSVVIGVLGFLDWLPFATGLVWWLYIMLFIVGGIVWEFKMRSQGLIRTVSNMDRKNSIRKGVEILVLTDQRILREEQAAIPLDEILSIRSHHKLEATVIIDQRKAQSIELTAPSAQCAKDLREQVMSLLYK